jgi:hypothetical protein
MTKTTIKGEGFLQLTHSRVRWLNTYPGMTLETHRITLAVVDWTIGWQKDKAWIAMIRFIEHTGMERCNIYGAIKKAIDIGVIGHEISDDGKKKYWVNWPSSIPPATAVTPKAPRKPRTKKVAEGTSEDMHAPIFDQLGNVIAWDGADQDDGPAEGELPPSSLRPEEHHIQPWNPGIPPTPRSPFEAPIQHCELVAAVSR